MFAVPVRSALAEAKTALGRGDNVDFVHRDSCQRVPESKRAALARPLAGQNLFGMKSSPGMSQTYSFLRD